MVKKKAKGFFAGKIRVKKLIKPSLALSPAQRRELARRIAVETEIKPVAVEPAIEGIPFEEPVEEIFEEPVKKRLFGIKSNILKHEEGSILTRNKNIFFKG